MADYRLLGSDGFLISLMRSLSVGNSFSRILATLSRSVCGAFGIDVDKLVEFGVTKIVSATLIGSASLTFDELVERLGYSLASLVGACCHLVKAAPMVGVI